MPARRPAPVETATTKPGFLSRDVRTARLFYRDLRPQRRAGIGVVSAGFEQCTRDYRMQRRNFPWYGVELVAHGGGRVELPDATHALTAGMVFSYGPRTPHAIFAAADRPPGKWFIDLAGDAVPSALTAVGLAPGTCGMIRAGSPARALFDLVIDTGRHSGSESDALLTAMADALLLALAHPHATGNPDAAQALASFERCRAWLDAHAGQGAGVQEAANALGLTAAYISRLFQRFDRVPPGTYARRVRLQQAADRLADTTDHIQDIAMATGYADAFHFSRAFRQTYGVPPSVFRTQRRLPLAAD
jgi:AraC-like DNA-binding protein